MRKGNEIMKPKIDFYPIVDVFRVNDYLSELYNEKIDVIDILFGFGVNNDTYVDYLVEEPEEEYHNGEWETQERWEKRKKIETYLFNEFNNFERVLFKICW